MGCLGKHFPTQNHAFAHLERHNHGKGNVGRCLCGGGWRAYLNRVPDLIAPPPASEEEAEECYSQVRYPTQRVAKKAMGRHHRQWTAYACTVCGGWHTRNPG